MVYVCSFEGVKSGGPELLHQLVYVLNALGVASKIVYVANELPVRVVESDVVDIYRDYCKESEWDMSTIDQEGNVLVVPETAYDFFEHFKHVVKVAWWLSVDNYKKFLSWQFDFTDEQLQDLKYLDYYHFAERDDVIHLAQSYYAVDFLKNTLHISEDSIGYLSDYINDVYFKTDAESLDVERKNMVIFNPAKGGKRLKKLIDKTQDEILWIPLQNLTKEKMQLHMLLAKVYVDFGDHPGKDRIPREAAISGCCVITGMRGAAAYYDDIPIPDKYKVDDRVDVDVPRVRELILDIFENYDERKKDFEEYRQMIRGEKERFVTDVMNIFT